MQGPGGHCAALSKIFSVGGKSQATRRKQESSPLLRSAARTPRAADDAETASSHSRSCSTAGDLHRIAPPPHLPSFLFLSLALQVRVFSSGFGQDKAFASRVYLFYSTLKTRTDLRKKLHLGTNLRGWPPVFSQRRLVPSCSVQKKA